MKQLNLLLLAASLTLSAQAANHPAAHTRAAKHQYISQSITSNSHQHSTMRRAAAEDEGPTFITDMILDQPAGELRQYSRSGQCFDVDAYGLFTHAQDGQLIDMVFAEDGQTVYLNSPVSTALSDAWVEAKIVDGKLHLPLYQCIFYNYNDDYGLGLAKLLVKVDEDGQVNPEVDLEATEATFTIGDDQSLTLDWQDLEDGTHTVLALIYSDNLEWGGLGDWSTTYTPFTETPAVIPSTVELTDYLIKGLDTATRPVKAGTDGQNFYISSFGQGPMIGQIQGDKVIFESGLYLGYDNMMLTYYQTAATYESTYYDEIDYTYYELTPADKLEMQLDPETKTLTAVNANSALVISNLKDEISEIYAYCDPVITPYVEVPGKPATPSFYDYEDYRDWYGQWFLDFITPLETVNGDYIMPTQLEWAIYVDDEVNVFSPEEGYYLSEDIEWFPADFNDEMGGYDIYSELPEHMVYLYDDLFSEIGIQTRACFNGQYFYSDILYFNVDTFETRIQEVENDDPIVSINTLTTERAARSYDLQGRRLDRNARGLQVRGNSLQFIR